MPPRLLSILGQIETALISHGCSSIQQRPERFVNYQKGVARLAFADRSGTVTLQSFTLADGQICLKAEFFWAKSQAIGSCAVYPTADQFDWSLAADKIAQAWMAGPKELPEGVTPPIEASEQLPAAS